MGINVSSASKPAVFRRNFISDPFAVAAVIEDLTDQFQGYWLHQRDVSNIEIALGEVINNINEHAYCGAPDRPIELHAEPGETGIRFLLVDRGVEMPGGVIPACEQPDLTGGTAHLPEGGFGWWLIRQVAHDLRYVRKNGENHISFRVTIGAQNLPN